MSSNTPLVADSNRGEPNSVYLKRLRALKDLAIEARRLSGKSKSLTVTDSASTPFAGRVFKDEIPRPVSRIGYAFRVAKARLGANQGHGTGRGANDSPSLNTSMSFQDDVNILPGNDDISAYPPPTPYAPRTDPIKVQSQRIIDDTGRKIKMMETARSSLVKELRSANSLLDEARSEIKRLQRALDELKESAVKKQCVHGQQLANANLKFLVVERDSEILRLRKENQSLVERCRRYRDERDVEKKNNERHLAAVKAMEMECVQIREIYLPGGRFKRKVVSVCDRDDVDEKPETKVKVPLVNVRTEKWQGPPVMATTPSSPRQFSDSVVEKREDIQRNGELFGTEAEKAHGALKGQFRQICFEPNRVSTPHGPHPRRWGGISLLPWQQLVSSNVAQQAANTQASFTTGVKRTQYDLHLGTSTTGRGTSSPVHFTEHCDPESLHLGRVKDEGSSKQPPLPEPLTETLGDRSNVRVKNSKGMKEALKRVCEVFKKPLPLSQEGSVIGATKLAQPKGGVGLEAARHDSHNCPKTAAFDGKQTQLKPVAESILDSQKATVPSGYRKSSKLSSRQKVPRPEAAFAVAGSNPVDKGSSSHQIPSSTMDQQERGNSIVGNGPKQESAGVKRREYKPPALRLVFTAGKSRPGSVDRELPPREIRKRQLYGWPQPSKKPDVFDARH